MVQVTYSCMAETSTIQILHGVIAIRLNKRENKESIFVIYKLKNLL